MSLAEIKIGGPQTKLPPWLPAIFKFLFGLLPTCSAVLLILQVPNPWKSYLIVKVTNQAFRRCKIQQQLELLRGQVISFLEVYIFLFLSFINWIRGIYTNMATLSFLNIQYILQTLEQATLITLTSWAECISDLKRGMLTQHGNPFLFFHLSIFK